MLKMWVLRKKVMCELKVMAVTLGSPFSNVPFMVQAVRSTVSIQSCRDETHKQTQQNSHKVQNNAPKDTDYDYSPELIVKHGLWFDPHDGNTDNVVQEGVDRRNGFQQMAHER